MAPGELCAVANGAAGADANIAVAGGGGGGGVVADAGATTVPVAPTTLAAAGLAGSGLGATCGTLRDMVRAGTRGSGGSSSVDNDDGAKGVCRPPHRRRT